MSIRERVQQLGLGTYIELYQLDLTRYNLGHYYFVTGDEGDVVHSVTFDGQVYTPMTIEGTGWGVSGQEKNIRPKLRIANVSGLFTPLVLQNNDLSGCLVTRIRTFSVYLDDGDDPDPSAMLPIEVYRLNRKTQHTPQMIQWELVNPLDQEAAELPNRMVVRDYCDLSYRVWNPATASFDYALATCPYNGTTYLDEGDEVVSASADRCGRRMGSCEARFGVGALLPFGGFPGVAKFKNR